MNSMIAIVGMACRYPDANDPTQLWENALSGRRAFRRMPDVRMRSDDYLSPDRSAPDKTYLAQAAVIDGYEFDRARFRVAGRTFRSADHAHWLALEVAADALEDAGFADAEGLPRDATGVMMGNTLTGEFSRANVMRLRWPYVRRVLEAALAEQDWPADRRAAFLAGLEAKYKAPFPEIGEESLAGGLSNTIPGRICNHFDLHGGGYTVDGACASSLLAMTSACTSLAAGDLDVALAGGVDLSLDPFEVVGFAKTGALAPDEMRVYDRRSAGFWPGEGCGVVVLMRYEDAVAQGRRIYASVSGWGVSSDGGGGITRPETDGQLLALGRAYRRAGFGVDTVSYFEGHGTGTNVGDATELKTLTTAIREAGGPPDGARPAVIGTIKANIGHTKAAAGVAGLIKATMALHHQVVPPTTGCQSPHEVLEREADFLRVSDSAESMPTDRPARAAVSAMGFGGINTHLALEAGAASRLDRLHPRVQSVSRSSQDAELFLFTGTDRAALRERIDQVATVAAGLSLSQMTDLAAHLQSDLGDATDASPRAAIVASRPEELSTSIETLQGWLDDEVEQRIDAAAGIYLGSSATTSRIGFLMPGQASPTYFDGGALARRFESVRRWYDRIEIPEGDDPKATEIAQPAIAAASAAAIDALEEVGIDADLAIGHSVGELAAFCWAHVFDPDTLMDLATARGSLMANLGAPDGTMAGIGAPVHEVEPLLESGVVVAGHNAPMQTVIAGTTAAVAKVIERAAALGMRATELPVSHAFHSPLMSDVGPAFEQHLAGRHFTSLNGRRVVSTVTGRTLQVTLDLKDLIEQQITAPVRFTEALGAADDEVELWIEAGPGEVLTGLVAEQVDTPVIAIDAGGPSIRGMLHATAAAFALGRDVRHDRLFADRYVRPFDLARKPSYFVNPCELAPVSADSDDAAYAEMVAEAMKAVAPESPEAPEAAPAATAGAEGGSALQVMRQVVAEHLELAIETVTPDSRLLTDLHLNSISVGQLVAQAARQLGMAPSQAPTDYATATVGEVATALEQLKATGAPAASDEVDEGVPAGVDSWVRSFGITWQTRPLAAPFDDVAFDWEVRAPAGHRIGTELESALTGGANDASAARGIVVCLPADAPAKQDVAAHCDACMSMLLEAGKAAIDHRGAVTFVLVQHGRTSDAVFNTAAGFARTLHLEAPRIHVAVVDVPADHPDAARWVRQEAEAADGFVEARYDDDGTRRVPIVGLLEPNRSESSVPIGSDDVLLVTGGGKGIAAESVLALARSTGVRLVLMGRSRPESDEELAGNLRRMRDDGVDVMYVSTDVTDADAVRRAVADAESAMGPVTAVLHGAGANVPQLIAGLDEASCRKTFGPKVHGLRHVIDAIDPDRVKLLVTFSSIIGRMGLPGEADYALANEWLTNLTEQFAADHPQCHCVSVESSVWSGVGMGQRLGRVDALLREGITPITPEQGVSAICDLIRHRLPTVAVVLAGRFGSPPTMQFDRTEPELLRFVGDVRVHYPGVELVMDVELTTDFDPYVNDHIYHRQPLFPAVMGMEAMTQAAMTLVGETDRLPIIEDAQFHRPVVVPESEGHVVRLAALVRDDGAVEVVLRTAETGFQTDHFRVVCRFEDRAEASGTLEMPNGDYLPMDTDRDLYETDLLFHEGRFRRLRGYRVLSAIECLADIAPAQDEWFGGYMPQRLVLGDPGARDAAIHGIQPCIPHARLLPIGVDRIETFCLDASRDWTIHARERSRDGDLFVYDMQIVDADGTIRERWEGLQLKAVEPIQPEPQWPQPLLAPYLQRRMQELAPGSGVAVAMRRNHGDRRSTSTRVIEDAVGGPARVHRRPDGKPLLDGDRGVSVSHADGLTLAVAGSGRIGCDAELIDSRPDEAWRDLVGVERIKLVKLISEQTAEATDTAASRAWAAAEALKKAGAAADAPLTLARSGEDGWVTLRSGRLMTATYVAPVKGSAKPVAIAILCEEQ
ncbi:MAG: beta keto-acyl synthase [Phycisphaeraceae bacterium]|nr:beta keto-acyl synthase [Phycisphaeraceae bacterium]